ncbi:L-serine ammonia-lyase, iron-sulfur-dependent, subunit beta [Sporanaerobium hydrogeniformans]|uniref:L-serine ammonia-lyase, iron-sulfur-dependent, subunit beta n=1 Tax=Sporanaerobium hydrogeniformans TaxID=3072179 RepID=A0AC61DFN4_9FIRM|nr:L-serine ammonia-lyase, iron-sulfur-dependent subunit beta [Sporanaerobium hydrogeniformans]PHV71668.1 L-serine ammonia-lyase, iron-sulfur-dependent, subunit beta [Sporanaerobium hydrogeniformans]
MKVMSVFDIIGPNMIGPSSSHTAGALRLARVMYKLAPQPIKEVTFVLYGSFAKTYKGHGTDKALVAGLLGMEEEDERIKEAFNYAREAGLYYRFEINDSKHYKHPNTVEIIVKGGKGEHISLTGASIGGGAIRVDKVNGIEVFFTGEYYTLFIIHQDKPGVVAHISQCLSKYEINIAYMRLYREQKGTIASTIIEADEPLTKEVLKAIEANPAIYNAKLIHL